MRSLSQLSLAALLMLTTGCQNWQQHQGSPWPWQSADQEDRAIATNVPQQMIVTWSDAVYNYPGKPPTRGFGGRVYFYDDVHHTVPTRGQLVVYAYDDSQPDLSTTQPTRKYVFTADQLEKFFSESQMGASYSIWLPWDELGGYQTEISLLPFFVHESGRIVRGTPSACILPGRKMLSDRERRGFYMSKGEKLAGQQEIATASYLAPAGGPNSPRIKSATIRIPPSLAERMNALPAQVNYPSLHPVPGAAPVHPPAPSPVANPGTTPIPTSVPPERLPVAGQVPITATEADPSGPRPAEVPLGQTGYINASPEHSVSAQARPWAREDSRSSRFERPQFRAPAIPGVRPSHVQPLTPPFQSAPPSAPERQLPPNFPAPSGPPGPGYFPSAG